MRFFIKLILFNPNNVLKIKFIYFSFLLNIIIGDQKYLVMQEVAYSYILETNVIVDDRYFNLQIYSTNLFLFR